MELQQLESSYPQLYIALRLKLITDDTFYTFFNECISIDLLDYLVKNELHAAAQLVQKWYENGRVDPIFAAMVRVLKRWERKNKDAE